MKALYTTQQLTMFTLRKGYLSAEGIAEPIAILWFFLRIIESRCNTFFQHSLDGLPNQASLLKGIAVVRFAQLYRYYYYPTGQ